MLFDEISYCLHIHEIRNALGFAIRPLSECLVSMVLP